MKNLSRVLLTGCIAAAFTACATPPEWDPAKPQPLRPGTQVHPEGEEWDGSSEFVAWRDDDDRDVGYGVFVCLSGVESATIEEILPVEQIGGFESFAPLVVSMPSFNDGSFISMSGYPGELPEDMKAQPIGGAEFTFQCGQETGAQQLAVGLRATDDRGGGWNGVLIHYRVDGKGYELEVPVGMLLCGSATSPCGEPE